MGAALILGGTCDAGHILDSEALGTYPGGGRFCRPCKKIRQRTYDRAHAEARKQRRIDARGGLTGPEIVSNNRLARLIAAARKSASENGGCWVWPGKLYPGGYGCYSDRSAHRVVYELIVGPIPPGLFLRHACDNPPCVNPAHLDPGTQLDNARDMVNRGRALNGERNPQARLTTSDVEKILELVESGQSYRMIDPKFGVSASTVGLIVNGRRWSRRHVVCVDTNDPALIDRLARVLCEVDQSHIPVDWRETMEQTGSGDDFRSMVRAIFAALSGAQPPPEDEQHD